MQIELKDEQDTADFAKKFYESLKGGEAIGLLGQLGAGKTTFVRYFAKAAGVPVEQVSSPSFVLGHEYEGEKFIIDHWDIYRLFEEPEELLEPPAKNTIRLIEWADKSEELMKSLDIIIKIGFKDLKNYPTVRSISFFYTKEGE